MKTEVASESFFVAAFISIESDAACEVVLNCLFSETVGRSVLVLTLSIFKRKILQNDVLAQIGKQNI